MIPIDTQVPIFFGYIISVLASVEKVYVVVNLKTISFFLAFILLALLELVKLSSDG